MSLLGRACLGRAIRKRRTRGGGCGSGGWRLKRAAAPGNEMGGYDAAWPAGSKVGSTGISITTSSALLCAGELGALAEVPSTRPPCARLPTREILRRSEQDAGQSGQKPGEAGKV